MDFVGGICSEWFTFAFVEPGVVFCCCGFYDAKDSLCSICRSGNDDRIICICKVKEGVDLAVKGGKRRVFWCDERLVYIMHDAAVNNEEEVG